MKKGRSVYDKLQAANDDFLGGGDQGEEITEDTYDTGFPGGNLRFS